MTHRFRLTVLASSLTALATLSLAQAPADAPRPAPPALTLDECVTRALQKNFDVMLQRFTSEGAQNDVDIARAAYDPTFTLRSTKTVDKAPPDTTTITTADNEGNVTTRAFSSSTTQDVEDSRVSVSQKVVTGAVVTATGILDRAKTTPAVRSGLNPAYTGDVGIMVRQPLLRGAGLDVNRAAIQRARIGVERSAHDLRATVLFVVRNVESAYYDLVFSREQREVRRFSLEVAQKLLDENRSRRDTGVATDLEVLQSEVGVANAQRDLLLAEQTVRNSEDALLQLIGQFEFDTAPGSVRFADEPIPAVSFDLSYKLARENQPDFLSTQLLIEQLKLDLQTTKNGRLPQLDVGAAGGYASRESSYGNASTEVWNGNGYNWQVDVALTVPWGFRAEKARFRQAQILLNREQARLQQIDQSIVVQVRSAVRAVETNSESVRISALATQLSARQFEQEKARYEAGLSTFRFVQQAQAELDSARVNELQARVNLRVSLAELARIEGSSLRRYNIQLAER